MIGLFLKNVKTFPIRASIRPPEQVRDAKHAGRGPFHPEWNDTIRDLPQSEHLF